jgi:hypothetical protein
MKFPFAKVKTNALLCKTLRVSWSESDCLILCTRVEKRNGGSRSNLNWHVSVQDPAVFKIFVIGPWSVGTF